jgi:hypothetical protein
MMKHCESATILGSARLLPGIGLLIAGVIGCASFPTIPVTEEMPLEGFAELLPNNPLRHSYDFLRADYGAVLQENEVRNAGSHIDYGTYIPGELRVGIQGGERGIILDLGPDDTIAAKLGVVQTIGKGQGFAHLTMTASTRLSIPEADSLFSLDPSVPDHDYNHVQPHIGHVYILRIRDQHDSDFDLIVKLTPVYLAPRERIAFQWVRLR